ncbi:lactoylglutathione lyase [Cytophagales bacterium WSM2-2]|nr:lactoylglutathione lyase [Cytophagales bacterium WSM2-2]
MKIEHIALWVKDLEKQKSFYEKYFQAKAGEKYINQTKDFQSYFLSFDSGCRLELMHKPEIPENQNDISLQNTGLIHFAFAVGSKEKVGQLTSELRNSGFEIIDGPRTTGDGYYESVVLDPEGNRIEITI